MDKFRAVTFFCRAVETRSFAAAAQALDVVPSALSRTITALERELGFTLFNRSTRRLALTEDGELYYARCRQALAELEDAEAMGRAGGVQPRGTLRIGLHPALRSLVCAELSRLLDAHPELRIETFITNAPAAVLEQRLDVVLCIGRLADSSLVARRVGSAPFVVCAAPEYLRRRGKPRRPADLAQHRAVIPARPDEEPTTRWVFVRGKEREVVSLPVRMVVRDGVGLVDAGAGGAGIVRPYEVSARRHLAAGALEALLSDWTCGVDPVYATYPRSGHVPAKVRVFLEFAQSLMGS